MGYLIRLIEKDIKPGETLSLGGYDMSYDGIHYSFFKTRKKTFFKFDSELTKVEFCRIWLDKYTNTLEVRRNSGGAFTNHTPLIITDKESSDIVDTFILKYNAKSICWSQI